MAHELWLPVLRDLRAIWTGLRQLPAEIEQRRKAEVTRPLSSHSHRAPRRSPPTPQPPAARSPRARAPARPPARAPVRLPARDRPFPPAPVALRLTLSPSVQGGTFARVHV